MAAARGGGFGALAARMVRARFWPERSREGGSPKLARSGRYRGRAQFARIDRFARARSGGANPRDRSQDRESARGEALRDRRWQDSAAGAVRARGGKRARRKDFRGTALLLHGGGRLRGASCRNQ